MCLVHKGVFAKTTVHVWRSDISYGNPFSLSTVCVPGLELGASGLATVLSGPSVLSQLPNKQFCFILCSRILWSNFLFQSSDTFRDKVSSCCGMLSPACKHLMKLSRKIMFVAFTECKIKCEVKLSWVSPQTEHCSIQCFQVSLWSDSFSNYFQHGGRVAICCIISWYLGILRSQSPSRGTLGKVGGQEVCLQWEGVSKIGHEYLWK